MKEANRSKNMSSLAKKATLMALSAITLTALSTEIGARGVAAIKVNPVAQSQASVLELRDFAQKEREVTDHLWFAQLDTPTDTAIPAEEEAASESGINDQAVADAVALLIGEPVSVNDEAVGDIQEAADSLDGAAQNEDIVAPEAEEPVPDDAAGATSQDGDADPYAGILDFVASLSDEQDQGAGEEDAIPDNQDAETSGGELSENEEDANVEAITAFISEIDEEDGESAEGEEADEAEESDDAGDAEDGGEYGDEGIGYTDLELPTENPDEDNTGTEAAIEDEDPAFTEWPLSDIPQEAESNPVEIDYTAETTEDAGTLPEDDLDEVILDNLDEEDDPPEGGNMGMVQPGDMLAQILPTFLYEPNMNLAQVKSDSTVRIVTFNEQFIEAPMVPNESESSPGGRLSNWIRSRPYFLITLAVVSVLGCCFLSQILLKFSKQCNLSLNRYYIRKRFEKQKMMQTTIQQTQLLRQEGHAARVRRDEEETNLIIEERGGQHEEDSLSDMIEEESALEFTRQSVPVHDMEEPQDEE